jgi:hypothetical protein
VEPTPNQTDILPPQPNPFSRRSPASAAARTTVSILAAAGRWGNRLCGIQVGGAIDTLAIA